MRKKYVDVVAGHVEARAPSLSILDGSNSKIVGPSMMPAAKKETSWDAGK